MGCVASSADRPSGGPEGCQNAGSARNPSFDTPSGVSGSSPEEALTKAPQTRGFPLFAPLHFVQHAQIWNRFWNSQTFLSSISSSLEATTFPCCQDETEG